MSIDIAKKIQIDKRLKSVILELNNVNKILSQINSMTNTALEGMNTVGITKDVLNYVNNSMYAASRALMEVQLAQKSIEKVNDIVQIASSFKTQNVYTRTVSAFSFLTNAYKTLSIIKIDNKDIKKALKEIKVGCNQLEEILDENF